MAIYLGPSLLMDSSDQPQVSDGQSLITCSLGLASDGVYIATILTYSTGKLLPHRFTLIRKADGLLSVALSL